MSVRAQLLEGINLNTLSGIIFKSGREEMLLWWREKFAQIPSIAYWVINDAPGHMFQDFEYSGRILPVWLRKQPISISENEHAY